ncbi:MAG: PCRF domain-containing protein, partial [Alphaproteobacteria bacterium]|nr:PCRF domain-containing protein [Alphaproteobacteria bacterium]
MTTRYYELREVLSASSFSDPQEFAKVSKEYSDLEDVVKAIENLRKVQNDLKDLTEVLADEAFEDDLKKMAESELHELKHQIPVLERELQLLLLPKDKDDDRNAIIEIRAGTGGDEAALFAADLFRMYQRYAEIKGWGFEIMHLNDTGIGGFKEATAMIRGKGVFARLKFESGVHRVQRVPATEASGRIHTSAATVAVLPEAEEVDIHIEEKDLRIDVFRSSGPGGQSVNTTDSAV